MTLYLSFRSSGTDGSVVDARPFEADPNAIAFAMRPIGDIELRQRVAGRNVLFATHGFNVPRESGARSLGRLEPQLVLGASDLFVGVLWPGDTWIPFINYPAEGGDAMDSGRNLAAYCRSALSAANSFSFLSHSLGARLVLEAVKNLDRPARSVCLTAAAVNRDCLLTNYTDAAKNADAISILASHNDIVLQLAFRIGDPISQFFQDDHQAFQAALGYDGPPTPASAPVLSPWQIEDVADYGHGDYLPPGVPNPAANAAPKWYAPAGFMERAFHGRPQTWPT